jgi:hypothetical protein
MRKTSCHRAQFIEPLESRRLLSGVPALARPDVAMARAESVQLVERDVAGDDGSDTPVPIQNIPAKVLAAMHVQFPGAELIDATYSSDDGPEYDVSARFAGRQISVAVQPDGEIVETGEAVSLTELPRAVVEWVKQNMSASRIVEAALVTKGDTLNYELVVGASGAPEYDVSLRVLGAQLSAMTELPAAAAVLPASAMSASPADHTAWSILETATPDSSNTTAAAPASAAPPAVSVAPEPPTPPQMKSANHSSVTFKAFASIANKLTRKADSLAGMLRGVPSDDLLRGRLALAATLAEVVPINIRAVELRLQQAAKAIDSLVEKLVATSTTQRATRGLAIVAASITAGQLALRLHKRRGRVPVLVRSAANSSWSWVIGTPRELSSDRTSL